MRTFILVVVAAVGALTWWLLPPRAMQLAPTGAPGVRGVVHVHSSRSDGSGTVETIAAAAARAGLRFVVFTDHGDATRQPDPPAWHSGVLCIDAVEVSTFDGHVVALGIPSAPYPLGGAPSDVVEDIHRLGGFAIAAHPTSPKPALAWHDWEAPLDGLEWLNGDTEWRDESLPSLARVLLTYPWRGPESLALLLDAPDDALARWDALGQARRLVALAVPDAHARIGLPRSADEGRAPAVTLPSYEQMFRSLSIVLDDVSLTGDAGADAATVLGALRGGRFYSAVDGLARGMSLQFHARRGGEAVAEGGTLSHGDDPISLDVIWTAPPGAVAVLRRDGKEVTTAARSPLSWTGPAGRAVYRVEVQLPGPPRPRHLLVSNAIHVGWPTSPSGVGDVPTTPTSIEGLPGRSLPLNEARIEKSRDSVAALDHESIGRTRQLTLRFGLGGTRADGPYAAAVFDLASGLGEAGSLRLAVRATPEMRLSVQLRDSRGGRWRRSIYVGDRLTSLRLPLSTFRNVEDEGDPSRRVASLEPQAIRGILLVADTTNTAVGANGQVRVTELSLKP